MPIENKICRLGEKCRLEQNMPIGTKYADWTNNTRCGRPGCACVGLPQTHARAVAMCVRVHVYVRVHVRYLKRCACVCVCVHMYACVYVCMCMHIVSLSEVQKIIVAALPRAHPMERMAKSSAWPMDRAWPKEKAPQR